ncbi:MULTISPECIES: hypothetical protein [Burkholderia]|uniref:hypothetical protein n=1 Tax=Burkholderia TaxID=32008 RepID=UPI0012E3A4CD|nr:MULTISPECIES: hypothetical protein [Burkholderia]
MPAIEPKKAESVPSSCEIWWAGNARRMAADALRRVAATWWRHGGDLVAIWWRYGGNIAEQHRRAVRSNRPPADRFRRIVENDRQSVENSRRSASVFVYKVFLHIPTLSDRATRHLQQSPCQERTT